MYNPHVSEDLFRINGREVSSILKPAKGETRKALAAAPVLKWHCKPNPFHLWSIQEYIKLVGSITPEAIVCQAIVIGTPHHINLITRESKAFLRKKLPFLFKGRVKINR